MRQSVNRRYTQNVLLNNCWEKKKNKKIEKNIKDNESWEIIEFRISVDNP